MMKTTVQLKNPQRIKIGSILKAKCVHYLERYEDLGRADYNNTIPLAIDDIVTLVDIDDHPKWNDCFALKFIYGDQILWLSIYKIQYVSILQKEFELIV